MRRALLLSTLLAPALSAAQSSGQVLLNNGRAFPNYVNAAECAGASIDVKWNVALVNGFTSVPATGTYTLYASNQAPANSTCWTADNTTTGLKAFTVGPSTTAAGLVADVTVSGSQLVASAGGDVIADCSSTADQTIYLCVQGSSSGTNFGFATIPVIVSTSKPPPPVITGAAPGDGALNMSWDPGTFTTAAPGDTQEYALEAVAVSTAVDPTVHDSGRVGSSPYRFGGLVNDVVYSVRVYAYSKADNPSDPSAAVTGMPEAVQDFWSAYKADGGRETGGCTSGAAGPVGLGVLLATLALVRRRK